MREPLDGLEKKSLKTQTSLAGLVLLLQEVHKALFLYDRALQYVHGYGKVVHVVCVVLHQRLIVHLEKKNT